jgi:dextranase
VKLLRFNGMMRKVIVMCVLVVLCCACSDDEPSLGTVPGLPKHYTMAVDKARYSPGEAVRITVSASISDSKRVRYKYLGSIVNDEAVSGSSWTWTPPSDDYRGYMAELYEKPREGDDELVLATVGIDVSSTWTRFPRYGFLSRFPQMTATEINNVVDNLNRHHINGIQFYDWHFKHHKPLAGTPDNPTPVYRDIINREIHFNTVKAYIDAAHEKNMQAMFYNLVYGALQDAANDGVRDEWYVYTDKLRSNKDRHPLSSPFISDIFLTDPSNAGWQDYLIGENRKVYEALPFDGFHMDQLGSRGARYDYDGNPIDLAHTYGTFVESVNTDASEKYNVMNAVNQYGQENIAAAPVDFLYTEVWSPNDTYNDLAGIILKNNELSNHQLATVLAAYVNYDLADNAGFFNTPSVLMLDAVIFAFGGAHIELGEHMLGKEYFPNNNLSMRDDLRRMLVYYYDFLVAYQNLLRNGGSFNAPVLISSDNKVQLSAWPAKAGNVAMVGKEVGNRQVIHLLNFSNAKTMSWRDSQGIQPYPTSVENLQVRFNPTQPVAKVWCASPDFSQGASKEVAFTTTGNQISFTIPGLHYWTMIVIEYQ